MRNPNNEEDMYALNDDIFNGEVDLNTDFSFNVDELPKIRSKHNEKKTSIPKKIGKGILVFFVFCIMSGLALASVGFTTYFFMLASMEFGSSSLIMLSLLFLVLIIIIIGVTIFLVKRNTYSVPDNRRV